VVSEKNNSLFSRGYRADIQGLRAIAVLLVIAFHLDFSFFKGGYIGVDVFYVISGYLISGLLFHELHTVGSIDFATFYARRIRRILPLSVFVALCSLMIFAWFLSPIDLIELSKTTLLTSVFSSNIWFIIQAADYFGADTENNPLLHTWSLGVEEQFYFIWPAMLALLPLFTKSLIKWMWLVTLVSLVSLVAFLLLYSHNQPLAFFSMPTRAWQFGFGALIYFVPMSDRFSRSGLVFIACFGIALISIPALAIGPGFDNMPIWAIAPTIGACLLIWAGQDGQEPIWRRILSSAPLVFLGGLSYSLYLWHWPVIVLLKMNFEVFGLFEKSIALIVTILLSMMSYKYVEKALRIHPMLTSNSRSLVFGGALVALGVAVSVVTYTYAKHAQSGPGYQQIGAAEFAGHTVQKCRTNLEDIELIECTFGDLNSDITIVVMGDSKAQQWVPILDDIGKKNNWKITTLLKSGCPLAYINVHLNRLGRPFYECETWRNLAIAKVLQLEPDVVFVTNWSGYDVAEAKVKRAATLDDWQNGYSKFVDKITSIEMELIFLRDNPQLPKNVPKCLSNAISSGVLLESMCKFPLSDVMTGESTFQAMKTVVSENVHSHIVDLSAHYCSDGMCPSYSKNIVRFIDKHHITRLFAKELSPFLEEELINILERSKTRKTITIMKSSNAR
jgi:peptidoglycan/LPS O-acetylase OafA/YrhL